MECGTFGTEKEREGDKQTPIGVDHVQSRGAAKVALPESFPGRKN